MNRYQIIVSAANIQLAFYVEAAALKRRGQATVIADGVRIDLPGYIVRVKRSAATPTTLKWLRKHAEAENKSFVSAGGLDRLYAKAKSKVHNV